MSIPPIIHQTWKTADVPMRWRAAVDSVKRFHPAWRYILWTDAAMEEHVRTVRPDFWPTFRALNRPIMKADVFRYVLMADFGGVYCDLDYEFIRPFPYEGKELVLAMEFETGFGDTLDQVSNYVFASRQGHPFWEDVLDDLRRDPRPAATYPEVIDSTGPGRLTRVFRANRERYDDVYLAPKTSFSPVRLHGRLERKILLNSGLAYGIHLGSGSWKDRWSAVYFKTKLAKALRL